MEKTLSESQFFGREKISKILLKIAPPVMLAQLIQALYNIVDSLFVVMKRGFRRSPAKRLYPKLAGEIFRLGLPNILMQSAYTFYIFGLNLILSGFFSGSRRRAEKFSADGSTYSGSVCTAGLSFLPIRPELVLADLSCHRGNYHCGRSRILQKFSGSSLCQECADAG